VAIGRLFFANRGRVTGYSSSIRIGEELPVNQTPSAGQ
jgi:hypothetical protein